MSHEKKPQQQSSKSKTERHKRAEEFGLHQSHSRTDDTYLWCAHDGQKSPCDTVQASVDALGVGIEQADTLRGERP